MRVARFWMGPVATEVQSARLHAVITSLLGLPGLAALFKRHCAVAMLFLLPLLVFPLPYYITHPDSRFRIVIDPLLTVLGAYAITRVSGLWKQKRGACPAAMPGDECQVNQHDCQAGNYSRQHQLSDRILRQE